MRRETGTMRAISRIGQAVNVAVERFVTVGEAIADDSDEIRPQMFAACQEARAADMEHYGTFYGRKAKVRWEPLVQVKHIRTARKLDPPVPEEGTTIEKLCEFSGAACRVEGDDGSIPRTITDRAAMVRAARCLLGAITRVLLLADSVVVKQLLLAKDKVINTLTRLESVTNFTEFVKAFSQFGLEMVELAQITSDRQQDIKDERRRAQMRAACYVLDKSTTMLLTSAKACLRHPDSSSARENRDTVFCQMRRAMDLIHYVIKDGVLDTASTLVTCSSVVVGQRNRCSSKKVEWEGDNSLNAAMIRFLDQVEVTKITLLGPQARQDLPALMDYILERIQDFTDSAYTTHEHRENILLLCDRVRLQLNQLLRIGLTTQGSGLPSQEQKDCPLELEQAIDGTLKSVQELRVQLQETALLQAADMSRNSHHANEVISVMRNAALTTDSDRLEDVAEQFGEHLEHTQEVCTLLRHISPTDSFHIRAKYTEINLKIYGPQMAVAARTLCGNPTSKIAQENLEVFIEMWESLMNEFEQMTSDIGNYCRSGQDRNVYLSLPRPGKHGSMPKPVKPPTQQMDSEEKAKIEKSGQEMKLMGSDLEAEAEKWGEENLADENNDIVRRAKNMSSMAYNMYQFTKGEGPLKTTQDLFTQAEYFAEEANRLYKVVRQFSYLVPTGTDKKTLLEKVDEVPTRVQQLQFTVKNPTVGKASTFTKVDSVIQETKHLMFVISKVVTNCFECASKYKLDFRGLSPRGRNSPFGRSDSDDVGGGTGSEQSKSGGGSGGDGMS